MFIIADEFGGAFLKKELNENDKDGFDAGVYSEIFDISDVENPTRWNGIEFEDMEVGRD